MSAPIRTLIADDEPLARRMLRGPAPLARRCTRLIEFVRARGSRDDATVLVVRRMRSRLTRWNGSRE